MNECILEFAINSYTEPICEMQKEYDLACTDFVESVTLALEAYECAYLLGQFEAVQEESFGLATTQSSSSNQSSSDSKEKESSSNNNSSESNKTNKKAKDGFFTKLVTFVNKMLKKLKHIASIIFDKIKKFFGFIRNIVNGTGHLMTGHIPKPFKNGFTINFQKGIDRFDQFCEGYIKLAIYIDKFFLDFLKSYNNDEDFKKFAENRKSDIQNLGSHGVKDHINMFVKSDIMVEGSNEEWAEKIFEYKFVGESWVPSIEKCISMGKECIAASNKGSEVMDNSKELILKYGIKRFEELRNNLTKIQKQEEQFNPTKASVLARLVNVIANYSNTGISLMTTATKFFIDRLNAMVSYLVSVKVLYYNK